MEGKLRWRREGRKGGKIEREEETERKTDEEEKRGERKRKEEKVEGTGKGG